MPAVNLGWGARMHRGGKLLAQIAFVVSLALAPLSWGMSPAQAEYLWQVGVVSTDTGDWYAHGVSSYLSQMSLPQSEPDGDSPGAYVGITIGDGEFYQVGYVTGPTQCSNATAYFYAAFDSVGNLILQRYAACQYTWSGRAPFVIWQAGQDSGQPPTWTWRMSANGFVFPDLHAYTGDTGAHFPVSVAELAGPNPTHSNDQLGFVVGGDALRSERNTTWTRSNAADALYRYGAKCTPVNVAFPGYDIASYGTGLVPPPCSINGQQMWP